MKKMKLWILACALMLMVAGAPSVFAAANVTGTNMSGTWTGELHSADGSTYNLTFVFKQHGSKLTGITIAPPGDEMPIEAGKVEGNNFSFIVYFDDMTVHYDGSLNGDVITLNTKSSQSQFSAKAITLNRSK